MGKRGGNDENGEIKKGVRGGRKDGPKGSGEMHALKLLMPCCIIFLY